jgi:hypothetical protein
MEAFADILHWQNKKNIRKERRVILKGGCKNDFYRLRFLLTDIKKVKFHEILTAFYV